MYRTLPSRQAQCAALVAAIISVIVPPQSLICKHRFLDNTAEPIASNYTCHTCDEHARSSICDDFLEGRLDDEHPSHHDCPSCIGSIASTFLPTSSWNHVTDGAAVDPMGIVVERPQPRLQSTLLPKLAAAIGSQSLPNVLRI